MHLWLQIKWTQAFLFFWLMSQSDPFCSSCTLLSFLQGVEYGKHMSCPQQPKSKFSFWVHECTLWAGECKCILLGKGVRRNRTRNVKNQPMRGGNSNNRKTTWLSHFSASCVVISLLFYNDDDNPSATSQQQQKNKKRIEIWHCRTFSLKCCQTTKYIFHITALRTSC